MILLSCVSNINLRRQSRFLGLYCAAWKCLWSELLITNYICCRSPGLYNDWIRWSEKRMRWMRSTTHALGIDMFFCLQKICFCGNGTTNHRAEKLFRTPFEDLEMDPRDLLIGSTWPCVRDFRVGEEAFAHPLEQTAENEAQPINVYWISGIQNLPWTDVAFRMKCHKFTSRHGNNNNKKCNLFIIYLLIFLSKN